MSALSAVLASSKANYADAEQSLEVLEVSMDGSDLQLQVFREGVSNLRSKTGGSPPEVDKEEHTGQRVKGQAVSQCANKLPLKQGSEERTMHLLKGLTVSQKTTKGIRCGGLNAWLRARLRAETETDCHLRESRKSSVRKGLRPCCARQNVHLHGCCGEW